MWRHRGAESAGHFPEGAGVRPPPVQASRCNRDSCRASVGTPIHLFRPSSGHWENRSIPIYLLRSGYVQTALSGIPGRSKLRFHPHTISPGYSRSTLRVYRDRSAQTREFGLSVVKSSCDIQISSLRSGTVGVPWRCYGMLQRLIRARFDHRIPGCHPRFLPQRHGYLA
jgi:hypothetical protein